MNSEKNVENFASISFAKLGHEKNVEFVVLVKGFPTSFWLQKSASIQPRTSPSKFGSPITLSITYRASCREVDQMSKANFSRIKNIFGVANNRSREKKYRQKSEYCCRHFLLFWRICCKLKSCVARLVRWRVSRQELSMEPCLCVDGVEIGFVFPSGSEFNTASSKCRNTSYGNRMDRAKFGGGPRKKRGESYRFENVLHLSTDHLPIHKIENYVQKFPTKFIKIQSSKFLSVIVLTKVMISTTFCWWCGSDKR